MPNQKTLRDVLPVLWTELKIDPRETERNLKKSVYARHMEDTGTICTPKIIEREWRELRASRFARPSPYYEDVLILDVQAIKNMLLDSGQRLLVESTQTDTETQSVTKSLPRAYGGVQRCRITFASTPWAPSLRRRH